MKNLQIHDNPASTKVQHLIEALEKAISEGIYAPGATLPSVNQISKDYNLSRDTVFKAFGELKKRGTVESTPAKGYHVSNPNYRVLLLLDTYSPFKDELYNAFRKALPRNYKVDLVFHHYNARLFEQFVLDSIGRYSMFVIMNFSNDVFHDVLKRIDPNKLLLLDLGDFEKAGYNYLIQDFGHAVYQCLSEKKEIFARYKKAVVYYPADSEHPQVTIKYFKKFCKENNMDCHLCKDLTDDLMDKETLYFAIRQKELITVIKKAKNNGLKIGADIGILAYNDTPVYEILENGITVISADFSEMGHKAAQFVIKKEKIHETINTKLIVRNSL